VIKESANLLLNVMLFYLSYVVASDYIWLRGLTIWFYFGVLDLHVFVLGFVWFVGCGCLECSCWGGSLLCGGRPSRSKHVVPIKKNDE
jgi:hypothetical protein